LSAAVGAAIAACQVVAGIERGDKVEATSDGGPGGPNVPDPCAHVTAPPPPVASDDNGGASDVPPLLFAVRDLRLTAKAGEPVRGFDLDKTCTCDARRGASRGGAPSCTPKDTICDDDGGIDNFGNLIFKQFEAGNSSIDGDIIQDINEGQRGLLVQIADWNGLPNDREVKVGAVVSIGISDPTGCNENTTSDRGEHFHPGWCGSDRWDYTSGAVAPTGGTLYPVVRGVGYVVDGQLVYRATGSINVFFGLATLSFNSATLYGKLEKQANGQYTLTNGILTGRIPIGEFLAAAGQFSIRVNRADASVRVPLCTVPTFDAIRTALCQSVDIMSSEVADFTNQPCDAISSAITFSAEQAQFGLEKPPVFSGNGCSPSDPGNEGKYRCP